MRVTIAVILAAGIVHAQAPAPVAFEVASIKRNVSGSFGWTFRMPPTGQITITNAAMDTIIREAYQLEASSAHFRLIAPTDNPLFSNFDLRFDIQAKPPDNAKPGQHAMLRTLLADRFKLRAHSETRETPVYALMVVREGKLGPMLRPSTVQCSAIHDALAFKQFVEARGGDGRLLCDAPREGSIPGERMIRSAGPISELVKSLNVTMDRPVVDETNLTGTFEWTLTFGATAEAIAAGATRIGTPIQEQLGLKLERKTAPFEVLVIDSVEMPSEN
jgi:uncharacterized protein (TIGR03435 family)